MSKPFIVLCLFFSSIFSVPLSSAFAQSPLEASGNTLAADISADAPAALALPEVLVTSNRLSTPLSQVTSSLTLITAKEMEQKQTGTVLEALQGVPGLDLIQSGGPGEISSTFIRGANPEHTLFLMDGIPLNDPDSTTRSYDDLDQLSVDGIKQIEVVRGPESPSYGSNAMGGVVNIVSNAGGGPFGGSALFEGGSFGTFRESISAQGGGTGGNFLLNVSRFDTAGFPSAAGGTLNNSDQNTTSTLKLDSAPMTGVQEDLLARFVQSRTSLPDGGGPGMDDPNYFVDGKQFLMGSQTTLKLGDWEQVLAASFMDHQRTYTDNYDAAYPNSFYYRGSYDGQAAQLSWQNNLRVLKGQTLVLGLQGQEEWGNSSDDYGSGPTISTADARTGSLFAETQTSQGDRLFETLGARLDVHSAFGAHTTFQAGTAYFVPGTETKLKATYGTGFRAPSLYQLYDPTYGNTSLNPETSTGVDIGFEQPLGKGLPTVGATYFHNDFTNLIDYDFVTSKYFNISQAQSDGLETFGQFDGVSHLKIRASYTYTNARDVLTGQPLLRRPQNKADLDAFYQWGQAELGTSLVYVGQRNDVSFPGGVETTIQMPSYIVLNLMGSFRLDEHLKLFARIDNLFNESYQVIYGYNTTGLSFYAGTKVSF